MFRRKRSRNQKTTEIAASDSGSSSLPPDLEDKLQRTKQEIGFSNDLVVRELVFGSARERAAAVYIDQVLTPLEKIPANAAYGKLESTKKLWSESLDVGVDDVINTLISPSKQLLISGARIVGRSEEGGKKSNLENAKLPAEIEIKGIALFKDGRLETWLDDDLARGTLWIRDELKTTVIPIPCKREEGIAAIEVTRSSTRVRASMEDGEPVFRVFVREEGNVNEVTCAVDLGKKEEILRYEDEWKAETERQIREAIRFAQSQSSDILGFGEVLNRSHPKTWKKLEDRWSSIFARCKTEVRAEAYIRRSGMRLKPYIKE